MVRKSIQPTGRGLPSTSRSLPIVLMRARESVMAPIRQMLADTGISEQQWRVLRVLSEHGALDASSLASKACLLMPSLTRISKSMIDNALIARRTDTDDKRRQSYTIAPAGQAILDQNMARATEIAARQRAQLGDDKFEMLLDLLGELDGTSDGT